QNKTADTHLQQFPVLPSRTEPNHRKRYHSSENLPQTLNWHTRPLRKPHHPPLFLIQDRENDQVKTNNNRQHERKKNSVNLMSANHQVMQIRFFLSIVFQEEFGTLNIQYPLAPANLLAGHEETEDRRYQHRCAKHPAA